MAGHVFITQGDLTKLNCDAWLLPTSQHLYVTPGWRKEASVPLQQRLLRLQQNRMRLPAGWDYNGVRVIAFHDWPRTPHLPRPYLVNVGGGRGTPVEWYVEGVRQFAAQVASDYPFKTSSIKRSKPLIALPLVGTGDGGARQIKGAIVRALLEALYAAAREYDLDFVLVTNTPAALAFAQRARRDIHHERNHNSTLVWPELGADLVSGAEKMAEAARQGSLVLFLGAGVSVGAGLPSWEKLLADLASDAGMKKSEQKALTKLHVLDRARIVEARLAARGTRLGERIKDRLSSQHHALAHSILSTLPITEVVTMNYDCLFEQASEAAGRTAAILPYESVAGHGRWLLKMHGCVNWPDDIVLTRENYLRYADRRAALFGIVQALLITRHMLFVGFSLSDDNFHRIADDVRKAVRSPSNKLQSTTPFGTALFLEKDDLREELWRKDLHCLSVAGEEHKPIQMEPARRLEIFLDYLLAETTHHTLPILARTYDELLTTEEREIRQLLENLEREATDAVRRSLAWSPVRELLERLRGQSSIQGERNADTNGQRIPDERQVLKRLEGNRINFSPNRRANG